MYSKGSRPVLTLYIYFYFIFIIVYIVERNACPCGSLIRVRRVEEWGKVDETTTSNPLFSSCICAKLERRRDGRFQQPYCISIRGWPMSSHGPRCGGCSNFLTRVERKESGLVHIWAETAILLHVINNKWNVSFSELYREVEVSFFLNEHRVLTVARNNVWRRQHAVHEYKTGQPNLEPGL